MAWIHPFFWFWQKKNDSMGHSRLPCDAAIFIFAILFQRLLLVFILTLVSVSEVCSSRGRELCSKIKHMSGRYLYATNRLRTEDVKIYNSYVKLAASIKMIKIHFSWNISINSMEQQRTIHKQNLFMAHHSFSSVIFFFLLGSIICNGICIGISLILWFIWNSLRNIHFKHSLFWNCSN